MSTLALEPPRNLRSLEVAIAVSVLAHAAILFLTPGIRAPKMPAALPTLSAVLRSASPAEEPPPAPKVAEEKPVAKPVETKPKAEPQKREQVKPEPPRPEAQKPQAPATPQLATNVPQAQSAPAATTPAPAAAPATAPAETKSAAASGTGQGREVVASAAPSSASANQAPIDLNAVQDYLVRFAAIAQTKYHFYPSTARENHWEGRADVRVTIAANGRIADLAVVTSSGYEILDKAAIESARKTAPLIEIKPALKNREFSFVLPFVYTLKNAG